MAARNTDFENDAMARRTFRLELLRAVPAGVLETVLSVFSVLILVKVFSSPDSYKSFIQSMGRAGLLAGIPFVSLVRSCGWPMTKILAGLAVLSAGGFVAAGVQPYTQEFFVAGLSASAFFASLLPPLQTQVLRSNYPNHLRGKLFARAALVRAVGAALFGLIAGHFLKTRPEWYPWIHWVFATMCLLTAWCFWKMPYTKSIPAKVRPRLLEAFFYLREDKNFAFMLISWMFVGMGMLMALAVHVDYLANPVQGLGLDSLQVTILAVVLPVILQLATTLVWGGLFDKIRFPWFRAGLNLVILCGVLMVFLSPNTIGVAIGLALFGVARGGGNVAWNLWVTKMAPAEHVAEYMSLHTFFTGIRGIIAPWLGFAILRAFGPEGFALATGALVVVSIFFLKRFLFPMKTDNR